MASIRCRRCIDLATVPSAAGSQSSRGCAHNPTQQSAYEERRSTRHAVADEMHNAQRVATRPHPMSRPYEVCRGSPIERLPLRARINQPSAVDIGPRGKKPCASCRFPSQCWSWPFYRAWQAANRRPNSEPARRAVVLILRVGAVCAYAAALRIGDGCPSPRESSCAANVRSTGAENGLAVDEPHMRHPKAAGAVLGICALCLTNAVLPETPIRFRISLRVCRLPLG